MTGERESLFPAAEWLKENALRLADDHREHCAGEICTVSLKGLAELLRDAGFDMTEVETRRLM